MVICSLSGNSVILMSDSDAPRSDADAGPDDADGVGDK
jgi:hypothetical protein